MTYLEFDKFFMVSLLLLVIILRFCLYKIHNNHKLNKIAPIVSSWIFLLLVLFSCYLMGIYAIIFLSLVVFIKSVHEINRLWRYSHKYPNKINKFFMIDVVLLICVLVFCVSLVGVYRQLSQYNHQSVFLFILFCIQMNDVFQYIMGNLLGYRFFNHKLAPTISPNKTIEGAVFGTIIMSVFAVILGVYLTPFSPISCFLLALLLGVLGVLGDLLESKVKRQHNIKDMGFWLKGHGGVLDRIDSLLFAIPCFWMLYYFIGFRF